MFRFIKRKQFLIICLIITALVISCSIFIYPNSFLRFGECFEDLWHSICYYFSCLFNFGYYDVSIIQNSSINNTPFINLPTSWEEFKNRIQFFFDVLFNKENFQLYYDGFCDVMIFVLKILTLIVIPLFIVLRWMFSKYFEKQNNDYNKETKTLRVYKKIISMIFVPVQNWFRALFGYIKQNRKFYLIWLHIFFLYFCFYQIIMEAIAYYLFFVFSFDFSSLYTQIYKLFCDLSVVVNTFPWEIWIIFGVAFIVFIRKLIGYSYLTHMENKNCGFINERPILSMVCGTMGKKKTTALTDMALSEEVILKDKAFEKILENDLKFPNFPWINFEIVIKKAIKQHKIFNLATTKVFIRKLRYYFEQAQINIEINKSIRRNLNKILNVKYKNLLFDYDYETYGLYYNDNLKVEYIFDTLETYAQLYFIYIVQSSLIISNYSIRSDIILEDSGNFPMWNNDFFKKDARLLDSFSRHAHILDFDSLRLGKKLLQDNPNKDSFEFGVLCVTEIGKERKNNLQLQEIKIKESIANQKNDGFTDMLKMIRHSATVDNYPFVKIISDEQRPESLGADARDLADVMTIIETSETKLAMPFFFVSELVYAFFMSKFVNLYYKYRFMRSDNTLFMYLFKSIASKINNYYKRNYNTFGYSLLKVAVENGNLEGQADMKEYYLMSKKIYSKRFSTDCFSEFFNNKTIRSSKGIEDLQAYKTERATFEELKQQNSYFVSDLLNKEKK